MSKLKVGDRVRFAIASPLDMGREVSTPADRIRRALGFCHRRFWSQKVKDAIKDAASAIAELERERDELRARLAEYEQAPTVAWLATQQHPRNPSQCVVTTKLDGWDHAELIARPTRKDGE